ncbi:MAG: TonB-dependent receptor, partial [Thermoanaerobaculia bacterium]
MIRPHRLWITAIAIAWIATSAFAQTTASLNGQVTSGGAPLPGVTVTVKSAALQGARTTVSGDNGGYSFVALPPGSYTVSFDLSGMSTVTKTVQVGLSQTARADADMKVSGVAEAIIVTATAPTALETPQVSANMTKQLVDQLPLGRTQLAAALLAPGVNANTFANNQLNISGGPGYDNLIMVNGAVVTENIRSQASPLVIEDAIQETTVLTGSVSAEWGRFTGGVVNTITKSGGNEFHGTFRDSLSNNHWTAATPDPSDIAHRPISNYDEVHEATLGGYVLRDRLWFFGAGRRAQAPPLGVTNPRFTFLTNLPYNTIDSESRYEGKLTGQITPSHSVVGSYTSINASRVGDRFTSRIYDLASLSPRRDPESLVSFHYNGIFTQSLLIESLFSKHDYKIGVGGGAQTTDIILGTLMRNSADSNARFNSPTFCGVCDTETRNNHQLNVKGNYFLDSKLTGRHTIVGGVEDFAEQRHANNHQSGSDFRVNVSDVVRVGDVDPSKPGNLTPYVGSDGLLFPRVLNRSSTYIRWTDIFTLSNTHNDLRTSSAFVNDKWDLSDHWSFNAGIRYDKNHAKDANGNVTSKDSAFSPRLSAIFDVKGDGRHRVSASFNRYVSRIVEGPGTAAESAGSPGTIDFFYGGDPINPVGTPADQLVNQHAALQKIFDWFNANGGTSNLNLLRFLKYGVGSAAVPGFTTRFEQPLVSPHVDEFTVGYGAQLFHNAYARVDYIHRDWKDFYASRIDHTTPQATDFLGIKHDFVVPFNTNDIKRQYQALQLQSQVNVSRFVAGVNYTYSKLRGNDEGENALSGTISQTPLNAFYPEINGYANRLPIGYLFGDQRHRARLWVGYTQPVGAFGTLSGSILHNIDSGTPYGLVGPIDTLGYAGAPDLAKLGYNGDQITTDPQGAGGNYYFSARDAYRLPTVQHTDLSATYTFPIWHVELYVKGDVINTFNKHTLAITQLGGPVGATSVDFATVNTAALSGNFLPFNPFTDTPKECPAG